MLSYRHAFHAGNFADVLKHSMLAQLIEALKHKDTPFVYYDTHSGSGGYDLSSSFAEKNKEYTAGVLKLCAVQNPPDFFIPYLNVIREYNPDNIRYYPGSPLIAQKLMRVQDKMVLCELHNREAPLLAALFSKDTRVQVYHEDGYSGLRARLPPKTRRGIIFIDPSYEVKEEYRAAIDNLKKAYQIFSTGIYCLWYPVVERNRTEALCRNMAASGIRRILRVELGVLPDTPGQGMTAAGLLVVNPPWRFDAKLKVSLPWLQQCLSASGYHQLLWLVPE